MDREPETEQAHTTQ